MKQNRSTENTQVTTKYKDTLFRMIFKEPEASLSLYNAVAGKNYQDVSLLKVVTLENAIYMNVKNDVAFLIDCRLQMYEHQASVNPNMPLRHLIYVTKEFQGMTTNESLYSSKQIKLPAPYFVVFYNGARKQPERLELRLSDSYEVFAESPALELKVMQLNIRPGNNESLKEKCPLLQEYVQYVERVQEYAMELPLPEAVERAVHECIKEGILADFLLKNRMEAVDMSIFEYDEERELKLIRRDEREIGYTRGCAEGQNMTIVNLVCKKLRREYDAVRIAEELEIELDKVQEICKVAESFAPEYDENVVFAAYAEYKKVNADEHYEDWEET